MQLYRDINFDDDEEPAKRIQLKSTKQKIHIPSNIQLNSRKIIFDKSIKGTF